MFEIHLRRSSSDYNQFKPQFRKKKYKLFIDYQTLFSITHFDKVTSTIHLFINQFYLFKLFINSFQTEAKL